MYDESLDAITLEYQPKFRKNKVVSIEAFIRHSNLDTEQFVSKYHSPINLDRTVIHKVYNDLEKYKFPCLVSINLSYFSFVNNKFIDECIDLFKDKLVCFELNEFHEIIDIQALQTNITKLSNNNIICALDNLGKDYAQLKLLRFISFDYIKIHKGLIKDIEKDFLKYKTLVHLSIELKNYGIKKIVYEGIENIKQINLINFFNDDATLQGFYFSKSLKLPNLLNKYKGTFFKEEYIPHDVTQNVDVEELLYNLVLSENSIQSNNEIKKHDFSGTIYNSDPEITINNFKKTFYIKSDMTSPSISKMIIASNHMIVIRNAEGIVIFDNKQHRNFMGYSCIGLDPKNIVLDSPDYNNCLVDDFELINSEQSYLIKKEIFDNTNYITIRQKVCYNDNCYIIAFIYPEKDGSTLNYDALTGCLLRDSLDNKNNLDKRYMNKVVAFIDLNGFKDINDTYGHEIGDQCLIEFTKILKLNLRTTNNNDLLIRFGGDEFVILYNSDKLEVIKSKLEKINQEVICFFKEMNIKLSFSYGVALNKHDSLKLAIKEADVQMYNSKTNYYINLHDI